MKITRLTTSLLCAFIILNIASADEQVIIDTDEKAKEIFMGHTWECKWKDSQYSWVSQRTYTKATKKKLAAKMKTDICPDGLAKYKSKIKGDKIVGTTWGYPAPCGSGSINVKGALYKKDEGGYYLKYNYAFAGNAVSDAYTTGSSQGTTICTSTPK